MLMPSAIKPLSVMNFQNDFNPKSSEVSSDKRMMH